MGTPAPPNDDRLKVLDPLIVVQDPQVLRRRPRAIRRALSAARYPPARSAARNVLVCTIMLAAAISRAYSSRKRGSPISSRRTSTV